MKEQTRFWQAAALGDTEMLHARYFQQRFAPHVHDGYAITIIESGAQRFWHRGAEHVAAVGDMVLINPDETHTGAKADDAGWRYRGFYPGQACIDGMLGELELGRGYAPGFADSVIHDPALARQFSLLHQGAEEGVSELEQQTAWREVILALVQRHGRIGEARQAGNEPLAVARAKALLDSQLDCPPSLELLAAAVDLSPFHFARVFRRATGLPPHSWLKQQRLRRARERLRQGALPLEVALELGFSDQSHLNRQFKQAFGITPGAYRLACASGLSLRG